MSLNVVFNIQLRVMLSNELKETLNDIADRLELSESDVVRMLIRNLKNKGVSVLEWNDKN